MNNSRSNAPIQANGRMYEPFLEAKGDQDSCLKCSVCGNRTKDAAPAYHEKERREVIMCGKCNSSHKKMKKG